MADLRIRNFSSSAQTRWVNFVMPRGHALAGSAYLGAGNGIIAARQDRNFDPARDADGGDWIYSVRSAWGGGSNTLGTSTLVDLSALGTDPRWSLELDDFYASGVCGSQTYNPSRFPIVKIAGPGGFGSARATIDLRGVTPRVVYSGNRYRCIEVETHQDGFHVFFTLHMWHQQVLGEWTLDVTWSDETVTDTWYLPSAGIEVDFGATPVRGKWQNLEGWANTSGTRLTASSQVTRFRLPFSFDNGQYGSQDWGNWNNTFPHGVHLQLDGWMGRAADLTAANHLEAVCTSDIWQGHYLNSGVVPDVPTNDPGGITRPEASETWSRTFNYGNELNCTFVPAAGGTPAYIERNSGSFSPTALNDNPSGLKHQVIVASTVSNDGTYTVSNAVASTATRIYVEEALASETDASCSVRLVKRAYYSYVTIPRGYGGSEPQMPLHFNRRPADPGYQGGFGFIHGGMVVHGYQPLIDFKQASKDFGKRPRYIMRSGQMAPESTGLSLSRQHTFEGETTSWFGREGLGTSGRNFAGIWCRNNNANAANHTSNTEAIINQTGIDPQHMAASALLAYYQLSLDPAAERLIHELVETEKLNNRSPAIEGSDFGGDREVGRWLATFAAIYKTFPRGSRVAVRLGDMLDVGRTPPPRKGTAGSGTARLFKWSAFDKSDTYNYPARDQKWNKDPITVSNRKIVDNGTVGFDADTGTIFRTGAWWDVVPTNNRMLSVFAGAGNANTQQYFVGGEKFIATNDAATVTGGDTITINTGTWDATPIVGRVVRVQRLGSPGGYTITDVIAAGSNSTTLVLTTNTVANESASFTIEEIIDGRYFLEDSPTAIGVNGAVLTLGSGTWTKNPHATRAVEILDGTTTIGSGAMTMTATTITLGSGSWTITPSAGHFITISGSNETNQTNNDGTYRVVSATANTITVAALNGTGTYASVSIALLRPIALADNTSVTITNNGSLNDTIVLGSGSWAATPRANDQVTVYGAPSASGVANNNRTMTVVSATANTITCSGAAGTTGVAQVYSNATVVLSRIEDVIASGNTTSVTLTNHTDLPNVTADLTIEETTVEVNDAKTESFRLQSYDTVKTYPNVTTAAATTGISLYTTGSGFSNSDARVIDQPFEDGAAGYVSPLFELMCGGGMYACYLATGETEWRDLALAVLENVVREGWIRAYDGSEVRRVYPWLMLADDVSGRRAPNQPRDLNVAANVSEGMHWYGVGGDKLRSWAAPGLYVAANYHPDITVRRYAQEALDYINETAVSGWLTNHYVAAVTGS